LGLLGAFDKMDDVEVEVELSKNDDFDISADCEVLMEEKDVEVESTTREIGRVGGIAKSATVPTTISII
jgi:hypothetical protein